jgi:hypothetical protein
MPANMQMFAPRPGERSRNSLEPVAIEAWDLLQIGASNSVAYT